jgi:ribonuclease Z
MEPHRFPCVTGLNRWFGSFCRLRSIRFFIAIPLVVGIWFSAAAPIAQGAPCLTVTLTGTGPGPGIFKGLAGPGTLVRYGDDANDCSVVKLQFDVGRATTVRLSELGVSPVQLDAVFFTHMHTDHTEGLADLVTLRWFYGAGPKIDVVCSADSVSPRGFAISCKNFTAHIGDAFIFSGEVAQRYSEGPTNRAPGGPADMIRTITFEPKDEPQVVWSSGDVKVSAIRSTHMVGHASYRVDTPAGSVLIGGDAGNDVLAPPRPFSTSAQVENLAKGVDIIVHSAIHPIMEPSKGSGMYAYVYYRQSTATDLGAMAKRAGAKYLMLTHLIPAIGATSQSVWQVPGGPLTEADYRKAVEDSGFAGNLVVGTDLARIRMPPNR